MDQPSLIRPVTSWGKRGIGRLILKLRHQEQRKTIRMAMLMFCKELFICTNAPGWDGKTIKETGENKAIP